MNYEIDKETPFPTASGAGSKYDAILEQLKPGQSIKTRCERTAIRIRVGMANRIRAKGLAQRLVAKQRMNMPDGYHRIFLMERPNTMANTPKRVIRNLD